MEATGVYWKPVYNILEGHFELIVANARHIKAVPGRKTTAASSPTSNAQVLLHHPTLIGSQLRAGESDRAFSPSPSGG